MPVGWSIREEDRVGAGNKAWALGRVYDLWMWIGLNALVRDLAERKARDKAKAWIRDVAGTGARDIESYWLAARRVCSRFSQAREISARVLEALR